MLIQNYTHLSALIPVCVPQAFQLGLRLSASVDDRGVMFTEAAAHPPPPAGLPEPCPKMGGADEEGGGSYCCY